MFYRKVEKLFLTKMRKAYIVGATDTYCGDSFLDTQMFGLSLGGLGEKEGGTTVCISLRSINITT